MEGVAEWLSERGKGARGPLVVTVALGELAGILLIAQTAFLAAIGDRAILKGQGVRELLPLFAGLLGAIAFRSLLIWGTKRTAFECASIVKRKVREDLIEGLRTIGPLSLYRMHAGEIAEVVVDAVESLEGYYSGYLPQRAIATLLPFTVLAVVFPLDWISATVLVLTAVFLPLSMIVTGEEARARNQRLWATLARMSGRFLDALRGLATVKMFGALRRETAEIERSSDEYRLATMSVLRIAFLSSFMLELITAVSIAIVAVLTGLRLLSGRMSFAPGYFILLVAPEYFFALRALGSQYHARMEAMGASEQIRALLGKMSSPMDAGPSAGSSRGARAARIDPSLRGSKVEFKDVDFAYSDRPILEGLTFTLEAGERLALVGPSGCGKSTVLNLILCFAFPLGGSIALDGHDIRLLSRDSIYEGISWLPQRPTLFSGSIRYNICLGRPGVPNAAIRRASRLAHVDEFAESLPMGLDSLVGEGGRSLSAGQAQRVALARLFLRSSPLLLLDEPTAHLDPQSEEFVNESIDALSDGRSLILVTHRPVSATIPSLSPWTAP